jgi:hypothetical protein
MFGLFFSLLALQLSRLRGRACTFKSLDDEGVERTSENEDVGHGFPVADRDCTMSDTAMIISMMNIR